MVHGGEQLRSKGCNNEVCTSSTDTRLPWDLVVLDTGSCDRGIRAGHSRADRNRRVGNRGSRGTFVRNKIAKIGHSKCNSGIDGA